MGGKVKYKRPARKDKIVPASNVLKSRDAQAQGPPPPPADSPPTPQLDQPHPTIEFSKSSIVWLSILTVLALAGIIIVLWLLFCRGCRSKRRKKQANGHRHHPSLEIKDNRNDFEIWNRSGAKPGSLQSDNSMIPLTAAAVRPSGLNVVHPGNPVIVEDVPLT